MVGTYAGALVPLPVELDFPVLDFRVRLAEVRPDTEAGEACDDMDVIFCTPNVVCLFLPSPTPPAALPPAQSQGGFEPVLSELVSPSLFSP